MSELPLGLVDTGIETGADSGATDTASTEAAVLLGVSLHVSAVVKLNLADFQNAVPAQQELAIVNATPMSIQGLTLSLHSEPAFVKPRSWHLDAVGAGATYDLHDLDVQLDGALLSRLSEAEPAVLHDRLRGG